MPSQLDREVIVLQAVVESIHSMVNHEILNFSPGTEAIQTTFKSATRRAFFNVLFADMLEDVDPDLIGANGSLLANLREIADDPQLGGKEVATQLITAVAALLQWLDTETVVQVWFPSIDVDAKIRLRRKEFITVCGNVSKHNVSRLTRNAKRLGKLLKANDITVDSNDALRALDDFQARFHDDIFSYHCTTMAELLTEVRWAIHEYLLPEFERSYVPPASEASPHYSYNLPANLTNKFAQSRYWDLMNSVRARPWIERFTGTPNLKGDY